MREGTPGPSLLLGPVLRYATAGEATIWVETDRPCMVRVVIPDHGLSASEPTWSVHEHHYALVLLSGLPTAAMAYEVLLDDVLAWPNPQLLCEFGPSLIRIAEPGDPYRLAFGSCRQAAPLSGLALNAFGADALVALAYRMRHRDQARWPDGIAMIGDQIYADETHGQMRKRLRTAHPRTGTDRDNVREEVANFEEYTWLYHHSWTKTPVRWLMSTVPSTMLLDDHDLRDDWNTSVQWREWVTSQSWWRERVTGAYASYWVYQHLGNLSPAELATDPVLAVVRSQADSDVCTAAVDEFAFCADAEPNSTRWSFIRDFSAGGAQVRLVAADGRCARSLEPGRRLMVEDSEWEWLSAQMTDASVDHLVFATTLPVLLLPGIHHLEGWDEALVQGRWGARMARFGEWLRQAVDLEHWAAFRISMRRLLDVLAQIGRGEHGDPPRSIVMISGDVHCSYVATARLPGVNPDRTAVHQLTMSPFRNPLNLSIRLANRAFSTQTVPRLFHGLARLAKVVDVPARWDIAHGPWFDNGLMMLTIDADQTTLDVLHAHAEKRRRRFARTGARHARRPRHVLRRTATIDLAAEAASRIGADASAAASAD